MFATAIIIFREVLEIALLLGIVLAATRGVTRRGWWIGGGAAAGVAGAVLLALGASTIATWAAHSGQELFNAAIMFSAAAMIGWTALWVRYQGRRLIDDLRAVGRHVQEGTLPQLSLAVVVGLALLREGSEIVLFLTSMLVATGAGAPAVMEIITGAVVGVVAGVICGWLLYHGLTRLPVRLMLSLTSWLLVILVAGLASQGVGNLIAAGWIEHGTATAWDSSWLLTQSSHLGKALHGLIGYTERPTWAEVITYAAVLALLIAAMHLISRRARSKATPKSSLVADSRGGQSAAVPALSVSARLRAAHASSAPTIILPKE